MDLKGMSVEELDKLQKEVELARLQARKARLTDARDRILKLLDDIGLSLEEVLPELSGVGGTTGAKPAKYVSPKDPSLRWSGHGRRPKWYLDLLEEGYSDSQLLI